MLTRENSSVTITIPNEVHERLLIALGFAAGAAPPGSREFWNLICLANEIQEGDPNWIPYEIPSEAVKP